MKAAKWRDLSEDEIKQKMRELTEEVFNLRFQLSMGVAKNPSRVRQARRDLARAQTVLHEGTGATPATAVATAPAAPAARAARAPRAARGRK